MALFAAAARRAATSSLPLIRASVSRGGITLIRPLAAAAARPMPFSSATAPKPSSDDKLPRVIKPAVQCDDDNLVDEDGDVFYSDGSLSSSDESSPSADGSLSSSDESSPSADDSSSSSVRIQEDQDENHPKEPGIHTTCISEMNDDSSVKFSCTIYPTERKIVINALALRPPPPLFGESDEDDDITETVDGCFTESEEVVEFRKLDVKLQHALYKLVEPMRYYTPGITELFQEHIMSKDRPRLLFWETKLWDFLNKYEPEQVKPPSFSPFKITDKGLEVMSRDEVLRMASSALKFAANCGDRNRDQDDKKDIENLRRYLTLRRVPKFLQEHIINKL